MSGEHVRDVTVACVKAGGLYCSHDNLTGDRAPMAAESFLRDKRSLSTSDCPLPVPVRPTSGLTAQARGQGALTPRGQWERRYLQGGRGQVQGAGLGLRRRQWRSRVTGD